MAILRPKREPAISLNENTDVLLSSLVDNQVIQYDSATGKWKNETFIAGTLSGDSDTTITTPISANILIYDGVSAWINKVISGDATITALGVLTIGNLKITNAMLAGSIDLSKLVTPPEPNATADQSGAEIKTAYQAEVSAFTDALFTKLSGIETGATADQSGAEIKTAYQAEVSAFTDALFTKLSGIATSATANDTDANLKARANHTGTQLSSTISNLATVVKAYRLDEFAIPTADISLNSKKLISVLGINIPKTVLTFGATMNIDFDIAQKQTLALTGISTISTIGKGDGKSKTIYITGDTVDRILTLPSGWNLIGGTHSTSLTVTANKKAVITLDCLGTLDSDIWYAYKETV